MSKEFVLDCHMHTIASGHAFGTVREMAKAASDKHLQLIGITEHGPGIPGTCNSIYFGCLGLLPKYLNDVRIVTGAELNVDINGNLIVDDDCYSKLDYLIVGIHCVNGLYTDQGAEKNTDNLINCMKNPKIHIISHPDTNDTPLNYERLAKAAKEYDVALEVNNSSLLAEYRRPGCRDNYAKMLKECMKYRTNIIVDSDAHDPSYVGGLDEARQLIDANNFDYDLILNTSVDKFTKFIELED